MAYILQTIEIKKASQKLVEGVKKLGEEKHARMNARKEERAKGYNSNIEVIHV
jgi:hypothetical protein